MFKLLLITIFLGLCLGQQGCIEKVKVDVYYESLCPDSIRFIEQQLAPNYQNLKRHLDINFVPFGKSDSFTDPKTGAIDFQCQHGPDECFGNKVQSCVLNRLPEQDAQVNYVACQMKSYNNDRGHQNCVRAIGLDWNEIYNCAVGPEGTHYALHYEKLTTQVVHSVTKWVPSIVYNHRITENCCSKAQDFQSIICGYIYNANPVCNAPNSYYTLADTCP